MSHLTEVETIISDLDILKRVLVEDDYEIIGSQTIYNAFDQASRPVDFIAQAKNGFQVGFKHDAGGTYQVIADWYGSGNTEEGFVGGISQKYSLIVAKKDLQDKGFRIVEEKNEADGSIRLLARRFE